LIRYKLLQYFTGDENDDDSNYELSNSTDSRMFIRMLGGGGGGSEETGLDLVTVVSFGCIGWALLLVTYMLFRSVRTAEIKLLNVAGCDNTFAYEDKLEVIQDNLSRNELKGEAKRGAKR